MAPLSLLAETIHVASTANRGRSKSMGSDLSEQIRSILRSRHQTPATAAATVTVNATATTTAAVAMARADTSY